jgi:dTDP-4-dehydrorhamnose reductase
MPRLLVTGVGGLLGSHVARSAANTWQIATTSSGFCPPDLADRFIPCDLRDAEAVRHLVDGVAPEAIVHCAALSENRLCESDPELAVRVNVEASIQLARAVTAAGGRFVFISTDLVFDGTAAPYDETATPNPRGWYARSKHMAEERVLELPNTVVVRTSLLLGSSPRRDRSVEERLARQFAAGERPTLFVDEFRTPLAAADLARALVRLAAGTEGGLLHLAGPDCLSRHALGLLLAAHFGWPDDWIQPGSVNDFPATPPRPTNVCLDCNRARALLGNDIVRPLVEVYPSRSR